VRTKRAFSSSLCPANRVQVKHATLERVAHRANARRMPVRPPFVGMRKRSSKGPDRQLRSFEGRCLCSRCGRRWRHARGVASYLRALDGCALWRDVQIAPTRPERSCRLAAAATSR
jgi:hypothetical protein